jgi:2-iminobutanoate/2-iminopropanoate deaminase
MSLKIVNTENAPAPIGPYNQSVIHNGTLFISGQIAIDPTTSNLIEGSVEDETHQVMKNIAAILTAAGSSWDKVIKCSIFLDNMDNFGKVNEVYGSYFGDHYPARECVEVAKLPKSVQVEISVVAAV